MEELYIANYGIVFGSIVIALIHTLIGVDHYVPFIALSKSNNWSMRKSIFIVVVCGIGHVMGSVLLGFAGVGLFTAVDYLVNIEEIRGTVAAYTLIAFGIIYTVYGVRCAVKNKTHTHTGINGETIVHAHSHNDEGHAHAKNTGNIFWGLFIFFVLGPCEPLIPFIMYPAATMNIFTLVLVTVSFSIVTISVMVLMTILGIKGIELLKIKKIERYAHALAGCAILVCGLSVLLLPI